MTNTQEQITVEVMEEQVPTVEVVEVETDFAKILKADKFRMAAESILEHDGGFAEELADIMIAEADRIEKSNARSRGKKVVSKSQKENEVFKEQIIEFIAEQDEDYQFTGSMLMEAIEDFEDFSVQKVTALLGQLVKSEVIDKVGQIADGDKKRMGYKLI